MKFGDILLDVQDGDKIVLLKVRLPNSSMKEGKSGGFRLICFFDKSTNDTILISLYPKKGKLGVSDLSKDDLEAAIQDYIEARGSKSLEKFEVTE